MRWNAARSVAGASLFAQRLSIEAARVLLEGGIPASLLAGLDLDLRRSRTPGRVGFPIFAIVIRKLSHLRKGLLIRGEDT